MLVVRGVLIIVTGLVGRVQFAVGNAIFTKSQRPDYFGGISGLLHTVRGVEADSTSFWHRD